MKLLLEFWNAQMTSTVYVRDAVFLGVMAIFGVIGLFECLVAPTLVFVFRRIAKRRYRKN